MGGKGSRVASMNPLINRDWCLELDRFDALSPLRDLYTLPFGQIYLNGNSLGPLPKETSNRLIHVIRDEWGADLVKSWNSAGWIDLAQKIGNKIARLVGAGENELIVADSTSINLYKALYSALKIQGVNLSTRQIILSEVDNFPSDLYMARSICHDYGAKLQLVDDPGQIETALSQQVAIVLLTEVNYRSAYLHDMRRITYLAHEAGALVIWDLSHSAGALPIDLMGCDVDFAVGCGYKFLCGGPGAPGFIWINPRLVDKLSHPLWGWLSHNEPFSFSTGYTQAAGIRGYQCGTPPILSLAALEMGVDTLLQAEPLGGMEKIREKAQKLADLFIAGINGLGKDFDISLVSPETAENRGCHVSIQLKGNLAQHSYAVMQALIARGVTGDFRTGDPKQSRQPDILRFGLTALTLRFVDVADALEHLKQVLKKQEWQLPQYQKKRKVT